MFPDDGYTWTDAVWLTDSISAPFSTDTEANLLSNDDFKDFLQDIFFEYDKDVLADLTEDVFFVYDEDEDDQLDADEQDEFWALFGSGTSAMRDGQGWVELDDQINDLIDEIAELDTHAQTMLDNLQALE